LLFGIAVSVRAQIIITDAQGSTILTGELVLDMTIYGNENLVEYIKPHLADKTTIFGLLDSELKGQYSADEAYEVATLALQCLSLESRFRPNMDEVVKTLEKLQVLNFECR
jgi:hypothetical protein